MAGLADIERITDRISKFVDEKNIIGKLVAHLTVHMFIFFTFLTESKFLKFFFVFLFTRQTGRSYFFDNFVNFTI